MPNSSAPELPLNVSGGASKPVECLGRKFPNDQARRDHFTERLRKQLRDPEFRKTPGFPLASDEDILRLSDPPYFTACPNPFLAEFVHVNGRPYNAAEKYEREPLAVDVSEGKTDSLYKAHGYHTKVPHLAIVPSILHYTRPGDIVLDGFAGSGMTGVAAQWCGTAPADYRQEVEAEWKRDGRGKPEWGARRAVLNDLSPAATFIAANYNLPLDVSAFASAATRLLTDIMVEVGWMYETKHKDGRSLARLDYMVWSEVFTCPQCSREIVYYERAVTDSRVEGDLTCGACGVELDKRSMDRAFVALLDPASGQTWRRIKLVPVRKGYTYHGKSYDEPVDTSDVELLERIAKLPFPPEVPTMRLPLDQMYHGSRLGPKGVTHIHHLFLARPAQVLAAAWRKATAIPDPRTRNMVLFALEQSIMGMSILNRHHVLGRANVNQQLNGVYYIPSVIEETAFQRNIEGKLDRLAKAFAPLRLSSGNAAITQGDCAQIAIPASSIDYIFTDPPFGNNIPYADLNIVVESWHRVVTDPATEATVDEPKNKGLYEYQDLMRRCFEEYHRVLKPGRWMTVVFSNSSNAVWRAIQEAMGAAGFVVADVRTLDKQQGSYRQVTSTAVKQDLVISAYKPTEALARTLELGTSSAEGAWAFAREHLAKAAHPVVVGDEVQVIAERTAQMLHDRMVAVHVQRGIAVPMDTAEFLAGLSARFPSRDGMYFLPEQAAAYDRARSRAKGVGQLDLFVQDEATAIQWVRQRLTAKPQSFSDLQPQFMKEVRNWPKHERALELRDLLRDNFLEYDGDGDVPPQIHDYLSDQYRDMRGLSKTDPKLVAKARGRWYVPNPAKQADIDKLRARSLLKEFEEYTQGGATMLKSFRTEAVRAGFKAAYDRRDWNLIVRVARRLPDAVLQEDEKLLMYYDVAATRLGDDA